MPHQLAFLVRVLEPRFRRDLPRLPEVVQEATGRDQIAVELRIVVAHPPTELEDGEGVLAETAFECVMDALRRRGARERADQRFVVEEAEEEGPHLGVAHLGAECADLLQHRRNRHGVDVSQGP